MNLTFGLLVLLMPATFKRMTRSLPRGVQNVSTYMDDMCIHTVSFDEHPDTLSQVFERIKNAGLTIKPSKVELALKTINFLCHISWFYFY